MPNTRETVRALVSAFNVHNYARNTVETNFTLQSEGGKDCIVVSFDKGMKDYQYSEYLYNIKRKVVGEFYGIEKGDTDEVVLNTANLIFNIESFPFDTSRGKWSQDEQGRIEFLAPIDKGVIFNLKSHLASSLVKDVLEDMPTCSIVTNSFNKGKYLCHSKFPNKELCKEFEREFLFRMRERYENAPKNPLKIEGNSVYIKDVFDDARFIDSVTRYIAWLEGMHLEVNSRNNRRVKLLKDMIIRSLYQLTGIMLDGFICAPPLGRKDASVLVPVILDDKGARLLTHEEALKLNYAFNNVVLGDLNSKTQAKLSVNGSNVVYGIDFSNPEISHCVITKIIESSVINAKHELSIDPELRFRALSPVQLPVGVPNGPSSGLTELSSPTQEFPTQSQGEELGRSPRRGSGKGETGGLLREEIGQASTSSQPMDHCSSPAPSAGPSLWQPSRPSSWKSANPVGANPCLSQGTSGNKWQPSPEPGPSGLSWKGANPVGANPWSQPMGAWALLASSAGLWSLSQSEPSSSRGAGKNMLTGSGPWCLPPSTSSLTTRNDSISSTLGIFADPPEDTENICSMKEKQQVTKEKEEEKLSKALLYTLNLMNYTLDGVYTNFFAKDGKIVSLLHDNVDREKYLQAVRDYIIKEYYETEKEARESCDFNEFPFKFLPDPDYEKNQNDCEEKQGKTVVANISSGALSNLKILFSQKFGKNVDAIDISAVKKVEEREKDEWVDRQRSYGASLQDACESCFPDEGPMKIIPIAFEGGEYVLDRSRDTCEVNLLFKEQLRRFRGTSLEKRKSSDKPLTEEEKNLFKELLYAFNYSNNNFDLPDTNFIVKNGKIASLIPDSVDVKEYLEEVKKKTKEEYCKDKKEAYDLDEFPFEFLSNCEKNQEITVVANISRAALFNLEKLFIYGYEEKVKIEKIDINIIKEAVKSKKDRLIDLKVKKGIEREGGYYNRIKHREAATACYPDENALEGIPIIKDKGGYCLDRTFYNWETESLLEELGCTKGTSKAEEMKPEDNKDSGVSSESATSDYLTQSEPEPMDHEGSPPVQQQNPLSDDEGNSSESSRSGSSNSSSGSDEKNTRKRLQERKSPSPEDGSSPRKSPKRGSLPLSRLESLSLSSSSHQIGKC